MRSVLKWRDKTVERCFAELWLESQSKRGADAVELVGRVVGSQPSHAPRVSQVGDDFVNIRKCRLPFKW